MAALNDATKTRTSALLMKGERGLKRPALAKTPSASNPAATYVNNQLLDKRVLQGDNNKEVCSGCNRCAVQF
jgi:hypothetical protein